MCSCARIGLPAATRPTSGSDSCARLGSGRLNCLPRAWLSARNVSDCRRMPRDVPPTSSITPLRASACRCSSAALAERKPSSVAISARVGGAPVRSMALCTRSRICCWRSVSLGVSSMRASGVDAGTSRMTARAECSSSHCIFIQLREKCKDAILDRGRPRHRRHDRRHRGDAATTTSATSPAQSASRSWSLRCRRSPAVRSRREQVAQVDSKDMDVAIWQRAGAARARTTWRAPKSPASSSRTAPTRWKRPRTSCTACWRRRSRWC